MLPTSESSPVCPPPEPARLPLSPPFPTNLSLRESPFRLSVSKCPACPPRVESGGDIFRAPGSEANKGNPACLQLKFPRDSAAFRSALLEVASAATRTLFRISVGNFYCERMEQGQVAGGGVGVGWRKEGGGRDKF